MHLATQEDLPFINHVMNHPKVRPHIWPGTEPIDCSIALETMWVLVSPGKGVMVAEALGVASYLGLTAFLPEFWGLEAVNEMRKAIRMIFAQTDCQRLYASVKPSNIRASRNLLGVGFKEVGLNGNRVTGHIDYLDLLDEQMFAETCKAGWGGKALYWWNLKAKLEDSEPFLPADPEKPIFTLHGEVHDYYA